MRRREKNAYAGYIPFAGLGIGAAVGGELASLLGLAQWMLAIPGIVAGYFGSRAILRRIYSTSE